MMDNALVLSDAQAPTTGTTASTNVLNTLTATRDIGAGKRLELIVEVVTTCTSGGSNTTQIVLQDSADNSSFTTVLSGPATAVASLTAGTELLRIGIPPGLRQYIRIAYVIATADLTAGAFTAYIAPDRQNNAARPGGFTFP